VGFALQAFVVAALVIGSAAYATWRLLPARLKLRLLDGLAPDTRHLWGRWVARLRRGVADQLMHGCTSCAHGSADLRKNKASRLRL
jgi:Family of unknown function (DUF6587)